MLKRAIRRARLHLPAGSVGQEDAEQPVDHAPRDCSTSGAAPDAALAGLPHDAAGDERVRRREEDVTGVRELLRALQRETERANPRRKSIERVGDETQRAADAWSRLQRLYGLFRAMEDDTEDAAGREGGHGGRRSRDQGLRSLLEDPRAPAGVMLRELKALPSALSSATPPQGFTSDMFVSLGDALYAEMVKASVPPPRQQHEQQQRRALQELGDALYVDAATTVVPVSAC